MTLSRIHLALLAAGALLAAAIIAAAGGWWTPWASRYIQGVDVSWHQGAIDWRTLASDDVAFAYIKATEGADHVDPRFAFNWEHAGASGLYRGAYHFFTLCRTAAEQAENFIAAVPRDPEALPPVVDAEHMGPCVAAIAERDHVAVLAEFIGRLEKHYGHRPIIYTTAEFDAAMLAGAFPGERFWARSLLVPPLFRTGQWVIWQYHNRGRRPGVKGDLDLNVFRGTRAEFETFSRGSGTAATIP